MNVERLHAIANEIYDEMTHEHVVELLGSLRDSLQQQVSEPAAPGPQERVSDLRRDLSQRLRRAPSNKLPPSDRQVLRELGILGLVGDRLRDRIEKIFNQNEITPSTALGSLNSIVEEVQQLNSVLQNLRTAFTFFKIGAHELKPGQVEVTLVIPRVAVHDELEALGRQFVELKRMLDPFLELSTGSREELRVRSISSSEFMAYVGLIPVAAAAVTKAVDQVLSIYERVLNIRVARKTLEESDVGHDLIQRLTDEADEIVVRQIDEYVEQLLAESDLEEGRKNELRTELRSALRALARHVDNGYRVEVRAAALPAPPQGKKESSEAHKTRVAVELILEKQERLKFAKLTGKPILTLPGSVDDTNGSTKADGTEMTDD